MCKIMKAIMKTMKRNIANVKVMGYGLPVIVILLVMALPTMAQPFGSADQYGSAPQASFQSTSTMAGSGSAYSSNPTLGNDGTATYNGNQGSTSNPRGAHKAPPINPRPGDPQIPIGDAVLPLMLCAFAYLGMRVYLRRKRALKG